MTFTRTYGIAVLAGMLMTVAGGCEHTSPHRSNAATDDLPRPVRTLAMSDLRTAVSLEPSGAFPKGWVKTPAAPRVIRKGESADTATYREGSGFTFLINSMLRPRLVRMDSGRLVLVATAWLHETYVETGFYIVSDDKGVTWTEPKELMHGNIVNLGGKKLLILGDNGNSVFSDDAGDSWSEPIRNLPLADGHIPFFHGSVLVEGASVYTVNGAAGYDPPGFAGSFLRRSDDAGRTWGEPVHIPAYWDPSSSQFHGFSEGSITRAANGDMVVAVRTGAADGFANYNDHWRRIVIFRSPDDGKTWEDGIVYFDYGVVHSDLLTLPNGDIVMTYAVRIGELDGCVYHGIEAVISHDHGKTWDWANRYYLFRWNMHESTHSPQSVLLADGRILTTFLYPVDAPWGKRTTPVNIGLVDALYWKPW